ncbi:Vacuolar calcium ion transporter, partial [Termitomyces sp. J132]
LLKLHDLSTHELALRIGGSKAGLVNASLVGVYMVSIVVAICALRKCHLTFVQSALMGSMLSKLLLVLGLCFFAGGTRFSEQGFDPTAVQIHSSLLSVSVGALFLPAVYHFALGGSATDLPDVQKKGILQMSHGVSFLLPFLFLLYGGYLVFQLWSHSYLYSDIHNRQSPAFAVRESKSARSSQDLPMDTMVYTGSQDGSEKIESPADTSQEGEGGDHAPNMPHEPRIGILLVVLVLVIVTVATSVTADWLVDSMDGISSRVSKEWVGLILLPAVTSLAECMTAVNVSVKDELSFSIGVAVGSAIQTALFVIPFIVTLAWAMGKPLSLLMDPFQSLVLYISVQTMGYVVVDGKSNWLEGMILICLYIIIAVTFWFYPGARLTICFNLIVLTLQS